MVLVQFNNAATTPPANVLKMLGAKKQGDAIRLPDGVDVEEARRVLEKYTGDEVETRAKVKRYAATEEDRSKVGQIAGQEKAGEFPIYQAVVSSNRPDLDGDVFGRPVLEAMARDYAEGRTVVMGSHSGGAGVGRTFEATVQDAADGAAELAVKFYILPDAMLPTGKAVDLLDAGVYDRLSIKAWVGSPRYIESEKDEAGNGYFLYEDASKVVTAHLAIVDFGANPDAKMKRAKSEKSEGFSFVEIQDAKIMLKSKYFNNGAEVEDTQAEAVVKALDTKIEDLTEKLKAFEDKEAEKLKSLRARWEALQLQMKPKATEEEKAAWQEKAAAFGEKLLSLDIKEFETRISRMKAAGTLDTTKADKQDENGKGEKKKEAPAYNNW